MIDDILQTAVGWLRMGTSDRPFMPLAGLSPARSSSVGASSIISKSIFFFIATATPEIYTLSLHDALPILPDRGNRAPRRPGRTRGARGRAARRARRDRRQPRAADQRHQPVVQQRGHDRLARRRDPDRDRKSTRLNSSHSSISYAVFCLKKK